MDRTYHLSIHLIDTRLNVNIELLSDSVYCLISHLHPLCYLYPYPYIHISTYRTGSHRHLSADASQEETIGIHRSLCVSNPVRLTRNPAGELLLQTGTLPTLLYPT